MKPAKYFLPLFLLLLTHFSFAQLLKIDSVTISYKYLVHIPKQKPVSGKYPLLLFLHGSGERGNNIELVRIHNPVLLAPDSANFPFLLIAPQCPEGVWWNDEVLLRLLDEIEKKYPVDKDREYVTGLSMGGYGTWSLIKKAPDRFAAAAVVCGGGDTTNMCLLKYVPVWAFHGTEDKAVLHQKGKEMIAALNNVGGQGKFTSYPGMGHNSWDSAYADPKLYEWLLQHKRFGAPVEMSEKEKKKYVGFYLYTNPETKDTLHTYVKLIDGELYYEVPHYQFKPKMYKVSEDLFRLEGTPFTSDSELFFVRDEKEKIKGMYYYPCDKVLVPKVK